MSGDNQKSSDVTELKNLVGTELLKYILNVEDTKSLESSLTPAQSQVLSILHSQISSFNAHPDPNSGPAGIDTIGILSGVSAYIPELETSLANALRMSAGGAIPDVPSSRDKVLRSLFSIARDVWPSYLISLPNEGPKTFWMSAPIGAYQHPAFSDAVDSILQDEDLKRLFPYKSETRSEDSENPSPLSRAVGYNSLVYTSAGRGGTLQLTILVNSLIADGVFRAMLKHGNLTWNQLKLTLKDTLRDIRALARGETVKIPTVIAFSGVSVTNSQHIKVAEGILREPREIEKDLFLSEVGSMTAIFETSFPVKLLSITENKFEDGLDSVWSKLMPRFEESRRSFQHSIDLMRMTLLMASDYDKPWVAQEMGSFTLDVLSPGGMLTWDRGFSSAPIYELDKSKESDLEKWYETISKKHPTSLNVGLRRLLSATTVRRDFADAFVDAVIVWENIFGVQTETTFRVTGSVAKLLEPKDALKRNELQKELKKIYEQRSRLVHGGKEPTIKELERLKARAVEIATECFRKLYLDRPDLLELDSAERGARLLLE